MHSLIMITVTSYNSEKKNHPSIEYIIKNILINVFEYLQRRSIQCKFILKHLLDGDSIDFKFCTYIIYYKCNFKSLNIETTISYQNKVMNKG